MARALIPVGIAAAMLLPFALAAPAAGAASCYALGCSSCSPGGGSGNVSTLIPSSAFPAHAEGNSPVAFVDTDDGTGNRLVATQQGKIYLWNGWRVASVPFLDLTARVLYSGERGLLALAVDPAYEINGRFYVFYTGEGSAPGSDGDIVIERYQRSGIPERADPTPTTVLVISHASAGNHNGGWLAFGPNDGYLYVTTGDGGGGCDSVGQNGQNLGTLLGKMLRLDVSGADATPEVDCGNDYFAGTGYDVPADNPLVGSAGCDEVFAYGLRNPFRFTFDRQTGDLFIADVGQGNWEEINFMAADAAAPFNFGWVLREGCDSSGVAPSCCGGCATASPSCQYPTSGNLYDPVLCHSNASPPAEGGGWRSIIAGYRYRGTAVPGLAGRYLYSDVSCGQIWRTTSFDPEDPIAAQAECWDSGNGGIFAFGEDHLGELYVANGFGGRIDCIHNGSGCPWASAPLVFGDDFESTDTARWELTSP